MQDLLRSGALEVGVELHDRQIAALLKYTELVAKWNRITNLVGADSLADFAKHHLLDCLAAVPFINGSQIVDVGSGAGLPGIVLSILRPGSTLALVESRQRKARFLRQVVIELALKNVSIAATRIQSWRAPQPADCIVCRGYSSLQKFYDDTRELHNPGCRLVAMRGLVSDQEIAALNIDGAVIAVQRLTVPGWDHRHLVTIECVD